MKSEYPSYTPESVKTPGQVWNTARTDTPPSYIATIVEVAQAVEKTRSEIAPLGPTEIDEVERHRLWYQEHERSLQLLRLFITKQIQSALDLSDDPVTHKRLHQYLDDLSSRHVFDSGIYLVSTEPLLLLSNLTAQEVTALYKLCEQLVQYEKNAIAMTGLRLYATAMLVREPSDFA